MIQSALEQQAKAVERQAMALAAAVDPDGIPASEAVRLYERLDRAGRAIAAAKTLLARRVDDSMEWRRRGFRSAAEHLAATSGTSLGAARGELETSAALTELDDTRAALVEGTISPAQGAVIAGAAKVNPSAEGQLIAQAGSANLQELREAAGRARAAADTDPMATHRRLHKARRLSRFTDGEGAFNLHARGTVDEGSVISSELDRLTDEIFRVRGKAGTTECRDAYQWDALLGDAVLKLVITKGVDVASVTSLTRGPTQAMRYAHLWSSPTCSVAGCSRTIVEYDHVYGAEFRHTRHTRFDETRPVCPGHHDLHTHHGWAMIRGPGKQPMVPPDHPLHPANAPPAPPEARGPTDERPMAG